MAFKMKGPWLKKELKKMKPKTIADQSRYQSTYHGKGGTSTGRASEYAEQDTVEGTLREATSSGRRKVPGARFSKHYEKEGYYDKIDKKSKKELHSRDQVGGGGVVPTGKKSKGEQRRLDREKKRMDKKRNK